MSSQTHKDTLLPSSPPMDNASTKRDLASWWKQFTRGSQRQNGDKALDMPSPPGIFGVPLQTSLRYANVAISLFDEDGRSYIYGYVPIVVAKCGVYLKEKATEVEGIFRLSGSEKRIKELRSIFDCPDRYGKGLVWTDYTVHDAANVLRRYFNQLPEPIIPLEFYSRFRDPLRAHFLEQSSFDPDQQVMMNFEDEAGIIDGYQKLIVELPPLNRHLLLYILDLLAVFASKSDLNKMTTSNLAAIFQPGTLFHPKHNMAPDEYRLNQFVLIFLIEKQDHFLIGMQGTAADAKTVQEVESGPPTPAWNAKPKIPLGRSASVSSIGGDSARQRASLRRNHSVSSKISAMSSPVTPTGAGLHRSNAGVKHTNRPSGDMQNASSAGQKHASKPSSLSGPSSTASKPGPTEQVEAKPPAGGTFYLPSSPVQKTAPPLPGSSSGPATTASMPTPKSPDTRQPRAGSERSVQRFVSSVRSQASSRDTSRQPPKLRKLRAPSVQSSEHSSTHSLGGSLAGQQGQHHPQPQTFISTPTASQSGGGTNQSANASSAGLLDTASAGSRSGSTTTADMSDPDGAGELSPRSGSAACDGTERDRSGRKWRNLFKDSRESRDKSGLSPTLKPTVLADSKQILPLDSVLEASDPSMSAAEQRLGVRQAASGSDIGLTSPFNVSSLEVAPSMVDGHGSAGQMAGFASPAVGSGVLVGSVGGQLSPAGLTVESLSLGPGRPAPSGPGSGSINPNGVDQAERDKSRKGLIGRVREKIQDFKDERKEREAEKARTKSPEGRRFEVLSVSLASSPQPMSVSGLGGSVVGSIGGGGEPAAGPAVADTITAVAPSHVSTPTPAPAPAPAPAP